MARIIITEKFYSVKNHIIVHFTNNLIQLVFDYTRAVQSVNKKDEVNSGRLF